MDHRVSLPDISRLEFLGRKLLSKAAYNYYRSTNDFCPVCGEGKPLHDSDCEFQEYLNLCLKTGEFDGK